MRPQHRALIALSFGLAFLLMAGCLDYKPVASLGTPPARTQSYDLPTTAPQPKPEEPVVQDSDELPTDPKVMTPFAKQVPVTFLTRSENPDAWDKLKEFWNPTKETATAPGSGEKVERNAITVKVPLGLTTKVRVPADNPLTLEKWQLGKRLFFDPILSADGSVSCATCHDPGRGLTDQRTTATGVRGQVGEMNAPSVVNAAYQDMLFWDGRAGSLELFARGAVDKQDVHALPGAAERLRANSEYNQLFQAAFGTIPTRDATAKALAAYQRTILSGNALHDRAVEATMKRAKAEGKPPTDVTAKDYEAALKEARTNKDETTLKALGLEANADDAKLTATANSLANGRALFLGKARCSLCHTGDNFTDNRFHNVGVGAKDGILPLDHEGRTGSPSVGMKAENLRGAFKTPTLRSLLTTSPYMHDGGAPTLEEVVKFFHRGGNANETLAPHLRDEEKEKEYAKLGAAEFQKKYPNLPVQLSGPYRTPVIPLQLNLTEPEQKDLVLFLKALQGDPIAPMVADPKMVVPLPAAK